MLHKYVLHHITAKSPVWYYRILIIFHCPFHLTFLMPFPLLPAYYIFYYPISPLVFATFISPALLPLFGFCTQPLHDSVAVDHVLAGLRDPFAASAAILRKAFLPPSQRVAASPSCPGLLLPAFQVFSAPISLHLHTFFNAFVVITTCSNLWLIFVISPNLSVVVSLFPRIPFRVFTYSPPIHQFPFSHITFFIPFLSIFLLRFQKVTSPTSLSSQTMVFPRRASRLPVLSSSISKFSGTALLSSHFLFLSRRNFLPFLSFLLLVQKNTFHFELLFSS